MNLRGGLLTGLMLLASILPAARPVLGLGGFSLLNNRNHPELRWQELRTDHFRIFFHDPLEPWARDAASILERSHQPLCRLLDVTPRNRTRVYLSDQDQIANGLAIGWDYFVAWIPSHPSARSFAGERPWFEEVLIHEYAHILISEAGRTWLGNLAFPLGIYPPRWLHEGIAQWTAESWSVLRGDRTLAAALLDGSMDRNPPGVPGRDRLLHYVRGHARIRWMAAAYGDSTIRELIHPYGRFGLYDLRAAERAALGADAPLWRDRFRREMIGFYGERFRAGEPADSIGEILDLEIAYPVRIAAGHDGTIWTVGQQKRGGQEASLFRQVPPGPPERVVAGGVSGTPVPLSDGRVLLSRFHRTEHGSWVEDLAVFDPLLGARYLTRGERVSEPVLLTGKRIAALADSPLGPSLVSTPLPGPTGAVVIDPLRLWPRGWILHSPAASPDGGRLVVSATGPDGRRNLWGISPDPLHSDPLRLSLDGAESCGSVWLDAEKIAWTSHRGGLSQVRTGAWPMGGGLEGDSIRAAVGTGAEVAGRLDDSLLVLDYTSRLRTSVRRVAPGRRPLRIAPDPVYPFPAAPALALESPMQRIEGPFPYNDADEIRRWAVLPLAGPQARQPAIGGVGLWAEPLLRHAFGGYLYANAGQASHPDRGLFYLTTRWGPWVIAFHSSMISARRVLNGSVLYERSEETGIAVLSPLHIESDPSAGGWVDAYLRSVSRRPRFGGRALETPLGSPRSWSSLQIGGGCGFLRVPAHARAATGPREGFGATASVQAGLAPWNAATRYLRGSIRGFRAEPLRFPVPSSLWGEVRIQGASGGLANQEFIGLDADASHSLLSGWPGLDGTVFLRGWPRARAARFVAHANLEARVQVLPDLGFRGPKIGIYGGTLAPFLEAAHPWGGASAGLFEERTRLAAGCEARLAGRIGPLPVVPAVAWGRPIGTHGPRGSWTARLTTAVPFSTPYHPRALLRSLLGGSLHIDSPTAAPLPDE